MSSDIKLEALAPKDDLLPEEGTSFEVYYQSLSSAFSNPKIRNLALSGSLGSGKSSIIRSFDRQRNGKLRFLYVSLIDFAKAVPGGENKAYDQQQLEYSLLSQIQSYCTYDAIPEGSIRGIPEKYKFLKLSAGLFSLLFLTAFVLIFHEKFGALAAMLGFPGKLRADLHLLLYLFAAIVLCGCVYCILRRCLPFLRVSKLLVKSSMAEAEVNLIKEQFSLDTHKFELAYILEQIGRNHDHTVVFEDLERLETATAVSIMTKLRELNTLTNNHIQAQGNSQPIRFLYAIADSTMPAEYRTKFYDCIIPVVPVSHPLNSKAQLRDMLKELRISTEWEEHLCDSLYEAFVDYRTLLSLRNEFLVMQALYETETIRTNDTASTSTAHNAPFLFAITAYRILLPVFFEDTLSPQGNGILPNVSSPEYEEIPPKVRDSVRKLFDSGLLDKTSMRLIIGEQALIEQWLKVIRYALDKETFDKGDEMRIRSITDALQIVFRDTHSNPYREPYVEFRKAMYERLCTLIYKKDKTQFILLANSLAAVSRRDTAGDWDWVPSESAIYPVEFPGFLRNYLCWLDELSEGPEPKEHPHAIRCLESLCKDHPEYQEHVLQYATELFNSSRTPSPDTAARLKDLWDACPENPDVALQYAKGLVNLSANQQLPEREKTIALLKDLRQAFPDNQEITCNYAMGLVNLSAKQQLPKCADTVALINDLRDSFPDDQKISMVYANGLVNLSDKQQLPECADTVALLNDLRDAYPNNQEIALAYATGLVNLSNVQELPKRSKTIALLISLQQAFPDNEEIAQVYAKGLVYLSVEQQLPERVGTVELLKNLREKYLDNQAITLEYAYGLVNLSAEQQLSECTDTVALLEDLRDAFPDNEEIALVYAKGLFYLFRKQKLPECADTIALLKNLWEKYPDNQEIALVYTRGLVYLSVEQQFPERADTVKLLKGIRDAYPDNQEITKLYAMRLFNLTLHQEKDQIPATVAEIADLIREHPSIIPVLRQLLDPHIISSPDCKKLYRPLLEMFDGAAAGS